MKSQAEWSKKVDLCKCPNDSKIGFEVAAKKIYISGVYDETLGELGKQWEFRRVSQSVSKRYLLRSGFIELAQLIGLYIKIGKNFSNRGVEFGWFLLELESLLVWMHIGVKMAETGGGRVQLRGNRKSGLIGQLSRRHITRDFDNKCEKTAGTTSRCQRAGFLWFSGIKWGWSRKPASSQIREFLRFFWIKFVKFYPHSRAIFYL